MAENQNQNPPTPPANPPAPPTPPTPPEKPAPAPVAPVRGEDCTGVPAKIRKYIDAQYGEDYRVLSIGQKTAYIQNAHTGFKIQLPK